MTNKADSGSSPVRRGALQVYDALREDILWLRIEPGSALDEVGLAARFKVSRTPVREALLLLSGEGFIQFLPNRTTIVAPMLLNNIGDYLDMLLILSRGAARSAALSNKADMDVMQKYMDACASAIKEEKPDGLLKSDNAFRRYLAGLTGNIFQIKYFDQVLDSGVRSKLLHYFPFASADELRTANADRARLAEAVCRNEADAADDIMAQIIRTEFAIVIGSLQPKFADSLQLTDHPFELDKLK